ncbi:MAG TPA: type IIL restriction-modification enzyme MmeI, partial [Blastocatellia bacterium]|nr:type IIL restriction-modification enzyme MmeI [Blastocatellia bacterium]
LRIVEARVRPERLRQSDELGRGKWWQFLRPRLELYSTLECIDRILVTNCGATPHLAFAFMGTGIVFAHTLAVFVHESDGAFCALQSRPHEVWARFFGSSMKDDLRYTPSDCFETFPFPKDFESSPGLAEAGKEYYEFRADLMIRDNEGLTKAYNRFHDPNETSPNIIRLRDLHAAMDRAVLDAYGWNDLQPTCEFLLDYEEEEDSDDAPRKRKKPWRYRWPDEFRDEVLARLLALNAERAEEERLAGEAAVPDRASKTRIRKPRKTKKGSSDSSKQPNLIEV